MQTEKLQVFMRSVAAFFEQIGDTLSEIDTPYLQDNHAPVVYDYSAIIAIGGSIMGSVYVSAPTVMLRRVLRVLGEPEQSMVLLKDLLGEIANTVAGNARTEFGPNFIISPPVVIEGVPSAQYLPKDRRSYVIPFYWQEHKAVIGICIWQKD